MCATKQECVVQSEPEENEPTPCRKNKKQKNECEKEAPEKQDCKKATDGCAEQKGNKEGKCDADPCTQVCNVAAPFHNDRLFSDGSLPSPRQAESTEIPPTDESLLNLILKESERKGSVSVGTLNVTRSRDRLSETVNNSLGDSSDGKRISSVNLPDGSKKNLFALEFDDSLNGILGLSKIILRNKKVECEKSDARPLQTEKIFSKGSAERVGKASSSAGNSPRLTVLKVCPAVIGKCVPEKSGTMAAAADLDFRKRSPYPGSRKTPVRTYVFPRWSDSCASGVYVPKKAPTARKEPFQKRLIMMRRSAIRKEDAGKTKRSRPSTTEVEREDPRTDEGADGSGLEDSKKRRIIGSSFKRGSKLARTEPSERPTPEPTVVERKVDERDHPPASNPSLESDSVRDYESKATDAESAEKRLRDVSAVYTSDIGASKKSMNKIVTPETESVSQSIFKVESESELSNLYVYHPISGSYISYSALLEISGIGLGDRLSNRSAIKSGKTEPSFGIIHYDGSDRSPRRSTRKTKYSERSIGDPSGNANRTSSLPLDTSREDRTARDSNDPSVFTADLDSRIDISTGCRNGSAYRVKSSGSSRNRDEEPRKLEESVFRVRARPPDSPLSNKTSNDTDSTGTAFNKIASSSDTRSKLNDESTVGQDRNGVTTRDDGSRSPVGNRASPVYAVFPDRVGGSIAHARSDGRISATADLPVLSAAPEDKNPSGRSRVNVLRLPTASDYGAAVISRADPAKETSAPTPTEPPVLPTSSQEIRPRVT